MEATSPETRYLIRVQAATADGPGIISDPIECYSDRRCRFLHDEYVQKYRLFRHIVDEPIVLTLVSVDAPDFEAEPNQTVTFRCSAQACLLDLVISDRFYEVPSITGPADPQHLSLLGQRQRNRGHGRADH